MLLSFATAVAVHELGHIVAARLLSVGCSQPKIIGPDARIYLGRPSSIAFEIYILIAGPLVNIIASVLALISFRSRLFLFAALSFAMGIINLFPVSHLDGGRILSLAFNPSSVKRVNAILDVLSLVCSLSLVLFTSYRMLKYGDSFLSFLTVWYWFFRDFAKTENGS